MSNYSVQVDALNKRFGRRLIFNNLNFHLKESGIFGITGANGSGKSTLVNILAYILSPSGGKVIHRNNEKRIIPEHLHNYIGFVSPYLVLYDEFTAWENLNFIAQIRGIKLNKNKIVDLLNWFLLYNRRNDLVKTYSSGMKQRLKFIFALMHSPPLIILDEPTSNLDVLGKEIVYKIIEQESKNSIIIIASNDEEDISHCSTSINLEDYKK